MIALYILLAILLLLFIVLVCPVIVHFEYEDDAKLCIYFLGIPVFDSSREKKPKKEIQNKPPKKEKKKEKEKKNSFKEILQNRIEYIKSQGLEGFLQEIKEIEGMIKRLSKRVINSIKIKRFKLHLDIGSEESSDTALKYGKACEIVFPAVSLLECVFKTQKNDVVITPNFISEKISYAVNIKVHIAPYKLIWAGLCLICSLTWRLLFNNKKTTNKVCEEDI